MAICLFSLKGDPNLLADYDDSFGAGGSQPEAANGGLRRRGVPMTKFTIVYCHNRTGRSYELDASRIARPRLRGGEHPQPLISR